MEKSRDLRYEGLAVNITGTRIIIPTIIWKYLGCKNAPDTILKICPPDEIGYSGPEDGPDRSGRRFWMELQEEGEAPSLRGIINLSVKLGLGVGYAWFSRQSTISAKIRKLGDLVLEHFYLNISLADQLDYVVVRVFHHTGYCLFLQNLGFCLGMDAIIQERRDNLFRE